MHRSPSLPLVGCRWTPLPRGQRAVLGRNHGCGPMRPGRRQGTVRRAPLSLFTSGDFCPGNTTSRRHRPPFTLGFPQMKSSLVAQVIEDRTRLQALALPTLPHPDSRRPPPLHLQAAPGPTLHRSSLSRSRNILAAGSRRLSARSQRLLTSAWSPPTLVIVFPSARGRRSPQDGPVLFY